jgi:hypothetical protein
MKDARFVCLAFFILPDRDYSREVVFVSSMGKLIENSAWSFGWRSCFWFLFFGFAEQSSYRYHHLMVSRQDSTSVEL